LASKGTKLSAEHRAKISASHVGMKGKKHSPETRAKISASHTGRKFSPETIAKMSASKTGKKRSPETIAKISAKNKGQIPWNKGKKGIYSPEHRAKLSASLTGRKFSPETRAKMSKSSPRFWQDKKLSPETRAKMSAWQIGRKHSPEHRAKIKASLNKPETRAKISASLTGKKHSPETIAKISAGNTGKKLSPETRAKMSAYRLTRVFPIEDTKIEIKLQEILKTNNIPFLKHKAIVGQPDIFIEPNICVFADGDYWHGWFYLQGMDFSNQRKFNNEYFATKIKRDQSITTRLEAKGYKVLRLWEHEIYQEPKKCLDRIRALL